MPLLMVRNDITKMHTDAIVNPANSKLLEGSGTSYAIYQAAGEELLTKACKKLKRCEFGQAVVTSGYNLQAKYIIHAVCPKWMGGTQSEEQILSNTYKNSLLLAKKKKCESVAFPLLSSGNLGFPKDKAMKVAVSAISTFLLENDMTVYLVLYDRESVAVSEKLLGSIEQYIDDNYVDANEESFDYGGEIYERERRILQSSQKMEEPKAFAQEMCTPQMCMPMKEAAPKTVKASKHSLDQLMNHLDETFSQMLLRLIDERDLKDSTIYKKANVDRRHFSKIRNNVDYIPTKKTVIAFAIALELSLDETVDLLKCAGYAFSKSSKFDVIICFFLENESYDIFEINKVLFKYDQPILGE